MPDPISAPDREPADAKAWFYLDNRRDIEMWATLRNDASALLDRHLVSLAPWFEELAAEVDAEPDMGNIESGSWPRLGLRRQSWEHLGMEDVSVVLQWERARLLKPGPNEWPFVAVRISRNQDDQERRQSLTEAVGPARKLLGAEKAPRWPLWRYVAAAGNEPAMSPESLITDALETFRRLWDAVAPALDALHPSHSSAGQPR